MKLRILFLAIVTALVAASVALGEGNPGHGKPAKPSSPKCHPRVKVVLKGTLANDPATGDTSLQMTVLKSNKHGRAYVSAAQPVMVNVDEKTKIRRKAKGSKPTKTLDALAMGDQVKLSAKACKADLANGATPELTARHIEARAPHA